jgi:hypothetical protein
MEQRVGQQLPGMDRRYTPLSDHLYEVLRSFLKEILPDELKCQKCFDRFEYLYALVCADFDLKQGGDGWGPVGSFGWRYRRHNGLMKELDAEIANAGKEWPPLKAGLFNSSVERIQQVKAAFDACIRKLSWR